MDHAKECSPITIILIYWRCGYIRPLHRGGDRVCPNNYNPISVLPTRNRILEKHVKEHLSNHLKSDNLLYTHQSGFRPGHSTASLLLYYYTVLYQYHIYIIISVPLVCFLSVCSNVHGLLLSYIRLWLSDIL